jgi:hypothetical protein
MTLTMKPVQAYSLTIFIKELLSCVAVRDGSCSTVANRNFRESVVRKAMPFINITSAVRTTNLWRQWKSSGIRPTAASTLTGFWRVVLQRTPAMLGPKIEWALVMWLGLTGQFLIELFLTNFRNLVLVGWPVMAWALHAAVAS